LTAKDVDDDLRKSLEKLYKKLRELLREA